MVDPYDWLGLPAEHRPPNPFQILGIPESIEDAVAIRAAADRQFRRIVPHLAGENALDAERVWSEIEEARDLLLDPERRASLRTGEEPAASDVEPVASSDPPTISSDWEEAVPAANAPQPWWKEAPEASSKADPWWKEPPPVEPEAPPPPPPVPSLAKPAAFKPLPPVDPEVAAIGTGRRARRKRSSLAPMAVGGIVVVAAVAGGVYLLNRPKSPLPDPPTTPVAQTPKDEPRPKRPQPPPTKNEEPAPEPPLPKDFADALRSRTFKGHAGAVNGLAIARSGSRFASIGTDKTLRIWSVTKEEANLRHTFVSPGIGVSWRDGDRRILAADGLSIAVFEARKSTAPRLFDSPRGGVSALAASVDAARAATGLSDGYVRLWDTSDGRPEEWAAASRGPIQAVDFSPDGTTLLVAVADGSVSLWSLANRSLIQEWSPHPGGAIAVRFSPDGTRAATSGPEGTAVIQDLKSRKEIARLNGHNGPVTAIDWLPDHRHVVTVGIDATARMWSAETGQQLRWQQSLEGKGNALAIDPEGRFVLTGSSTGIIQLFPLPRVKTTSFVGELARPPADPLPIPTADAVATALQPIREELRAELGYTRVDDMAILADNLRRRAGLERTSPVQRYGLLREAESLAVRAGDPVTALKAIEDLAAWFELDELAEKAGTFRGMPPEANGPFLIDVGLEAAERAESDARPEIVRAILQRLPEKPGSDIPADRIARLEALRQRSQRAAAEMQSVRTALDFLKNASNHPESNQTYGNFLCLTRQDWATGLPHLSRGTDPRFIEAARTDLSAPLEPRAQHKLGELWYALAIDAQDPRARRALLGWARYWFERESKAKLEVADAIKVRARLDDIGKLDVPSRDPSALPLFSPIIMRRAYNTIRAEVVRDEWRLEGGAEARMGRVALPAGSPVLQNRFGLAPGGKLTLNFQTDGREIRVTGGGQEMAFLGTGKQLRLVIERTEDKLTFTATSDGAEPTTRMAELPAAFRGPLFFSIRMTGNSDRPDGAWLENTLLRGPTYLPLPFVE